MYRTTTGGPAAAAHSYDEGAAPDALPLLGWPLGLRRVSMRMKIAASAHESDMAIMSTSNNEGSYMNGAADEINCFDFPSFSSSSSSSSSFAACSSSSAADLDHDNESATSFFPDLRSITLGSLMGFSSRIDNVAGGSSGDILDTSTLGGEMCPGSGRGARSSIIVADDGVECHRRQRSGRMRRRLLACRTCLARGRLIGGGAPTQRQRHGLAVSQPRCNEPSSSCCTTSACPAVHIPSSTSRCRGYCCLHISAAPTSPQLQDCHHHNCTRTLAPPSPRHFVSSVNAISCESTASEPHSLADFLAQEKLEEQSMSRTLANASTGSADAEGPQKKSLTAKIEQELCNMDDYEAANVRPIVPVNVATDDGMWTTFGGTTTMATTRVYANILYEEEEQGKEKKGAELVDVERNTESGSKNDMMSSLRRSSAVRKGIGPRRLRRCRRSAGIVRVIMAGRGMANDNDSEQRVAGKKQRPAVLYSNLSFEDEPPSGSTLMAG